MIFKILIVAVAVFTSQVNSQGIIRPFATGFANGFSEMAKPFIALGQSVMSPPNGYITSQHRPGISQWMSYPAQIIPQGQGQAYEGYETITPGMAGTGYFQGIGPSPVFRPQTPSVFKPQPPTDFRPQLPIDFRPQPFEPISSPSAFARPPRPYPALVPVSPSSSSSSSSEESSEIYRPSNLIIQPNPTEIETEISKIPQGAMTLEKELEDSTLQRPLE